MFVSRGAYEGRSCRFSGTCLSISHASPPVHAQADVLKSSSNARAAPSVGLPRRHPCLSTIERMQRRKQKVRSRNQNQPAQLPNITSVQFTTTCVCLLTSAATKITITDGERPSVFSGAESSAGCSGMSDPFDLFDASISTIFDVPPIAFSADQGGHYTYTPPEGPSINLRIPDPPAAHQNLQANHLWLSAVYLAEQICANIINLQGQRVAELGAGAGLPSVMASRKGAEVVCTDWSVEEVLQAIRHNMGGKGAVVGHEWGTDVQPILDALGGPKRFDAVMLADTLWVTDAHQQLLDSITALLKPSGTAYVAAGLHTGRGPVERFRSAASERGLTLGAMTEVQWVRGQFEPYQGREGLEEERGVVIFFTMQT